MFRKGGVKCGGCEEEMVLNCFVNRFDEVEVILGRGRKCLGKGIIRRNLFLGNE